MQTHMLLPLCDAHKRGPLEWLLLVVHLKRGNFSWGIASITLAYMVVGMFLIANWYRRPHPWADGPGSRKETDWEIQEASQETTFLPSDCCLDFPRLWTIICKPNNPFLSQLVLVSLIKAMNNKLEPALIRTYKCSTEDFRSLKQLDKSNLLFLQCCLSQIFCYNYEGSHLITHNYAHIHTCIYARICAHLCMEAVPLLCEICPITSDISWSDSPPHGKTFSPTY